MQESITSNSDIQWKILEQALIKVGLGWLLAESQPRVYFLPEQSH